MGTSHISAHHYRVGRSLRLITTVPVAYDAISCALTPISRHSCVSCLSLRPPLSSEVQLKASQSLCWTAHLRKVSDSSDGVLTDMDVLQPPVIPNSNIKLPFNWPD